QALEQQQAQHQADLLRLDRLEGSLEERDKALQAREQAHEQQVKQLQEDSADLEEQVLHIENMRAEMAVERQRLTLQKTESESLTNQLAQRAAAPEGQQATLAG